MKLLSCGSILSRAGWGLHGRLLEGFRIRWRSAGEERDRFQGESCLSALGNRVENVLEGRFEISPKVWLLFWPPALDFKGLLVLRMLYYSFKTVPCFKKKSFFFLFPIKPESLELCMCLGHWQFSKCCVSPIFWFSRLKVYKSLVCFSIK